jgi:hypothetical protein
MDHRARDTTRGRHSGFVLVLCAGFVGLVRDEAGQTLRFPGAAVRREDALSAAHSRRAGRHPPRWTGMQ